MLDMVPKHFIKKKSTNYLSASRLYFKVYLYRCLQATFQTAYYNVKVNTVFYNNVKYINQLFDRIMFKVWNQKPNHHKIPFNPQYIPDTVLYACKIFFCET